jgi:tRNA pseudouridine38-40 synthase
MNPPTPEGGSTAPSGRERPAEDPSGANARPAAAGPAEAGTAEAGTAGEPAVRLRLNLAYDGTGFSGWARQPGQRTVQAVVEDALGRLLRRPPPALTVAGRTDAGVHARGQVAHTDVPAASWEAIADRAVHRLAGMLPADVRIRTVISAPDTFDARFSALWRRYSYRVCDEPSGPDPLRRHEILRHRHPLALERMNAAALALAGEHDFAAFCRKRDGATTVRSLIRLDWAREGPDLAVATVVADAFCHNMVRSLVGALLAVGDGRKPVSWPADVLNAGVRDPAVHVVPAHGLCLEEVRYPPEGELAQRASRTRRVRHLGSAALGSAALGSASEPTAGGPPG